MLVNIGNDRHSLNDIVLFDCRDFPEQYVLSWRNVRQRLAGLLSEDAVDVHEPKPLERLHLYRSVAALHSTSVHWRCRRC